MALKLDGFLPPYRGSGDNWGQFLTKCHVLAEVSGWDTEEKNENPVPTLHQRSGISYLFEDASAGKEEVEKGQ